jgi:hypothetical protein
MSQCPRCPNSILTVAVCTFCMCGIAADEPPHIENHYTAMFVREPVRAAFTAVFTATMVSTVTWRVPSVEEPESG